MEVPTSPTSPCTPTQPLQRMLTRIEGVWPIYTEAPSTAQTILVPATQRQYSTWFDDDEVARDKSIPVLKTPDF